MRRWHHYFNVAALHGCVSAAWVMRSLGSAVLADSPESFWWLICPTTTRCMEFLREGKSVVKFALFLTLLWIYCLCQYLIFEGEIYILICPPEEKLWDKMRPLCKDERSICGHSALPSSQIIPPTSRFFGPLLPNVRLMSNAVQGISDIMTSSLWQIFDIMTILGIPDSKCHFTT